jgi:hypothetical protein
MDPSQLADARERDLADLKAGLLPDRSDYHDFTITPYPVQWEIIKFRNPGTWLTNPLNAFMMENMMHPERIACHEYNTDKNNVRRTPLERFGFKTFVPPAQLYFLWKQEADEKGWIIPPPFEDEYLKLTHPWYDMDRDYEYVKRVRNPPS